MEDRETCVDTKIQDTTTTEKKTEMKKKNKAAPGTCLFLGSRFPDPRIRALAQRTPILASRSGCTHAHMLHGRHQRNASIKTKKTKKPRGVAANRRGQQQLQRCLAAGACISRICVSSACETHTFGTNIKKHKGMGILRTN